MLKRSLSLLAFAFGFAAVCAVLLCGSSAQAQQIGPGLGPLYWNAGSSDGAWDTTTTNWTASGGNQGIPGNTTWINDGTYDAQLADQTNAPGTITLDPATPINV